MRISSKLRVDGRLILCVLIGKGIVGNENWNVNVAREKEKHDCGYQGIGDVV